MRIEVLIIHGKKELSSDLDFFPQSFGWAGGPTRVEYFIYYNMKYHGIARVTVCWSVHIYGVNVLHVTVTINN